MVNLHGLQVLYLFMRCSLRIGHTTVDGLCRRADEVFPPCLLDVAVWDLMHESGSIF